MNVWRNEDAFTLINARCASFTIIGTPTKRELTSGVGLMYSTVH